MKLFVIIAMLSPAVFAVSPIVVFSDSTSGVFNTNWKNLAEWFLKGSPPTYGSQKSATDSAITDWHIREDSGYYRITIAHASARKMFPDSFPWTLNDWNFNAIGIDSLLNIITPERRIKIIFHLLGYPRWLMLPEDTVRPAPWVGWFVGDTKLPIFAGSTDSGLVLYSQLITAFCNHYDSMGVDFSMTIMAEPNLETHWTGTWDDANRFYEAFVNGVNASDAGTAIKVGGLVWAAGGQYSGTLDSIIMWAQYWRNFCIDNDVRYDFICYHHYWRSPDRFDTVANAFETAFPEDQFWITEWNYKYNRFLPYDEYERYVVGMAGATGNLDFLMRAQKRPSHPIMTHFCVIGGYKDYGICHWRDSTNWDYTASGQAFRWLADFGNSQLTIENASPAISVLAAKNDDKIDAILFNYNYPLDSAEFTITLGDVDTYYYEIWKMSEDSFITSLFFIANIIPPDSIEWIDTIIHIPVPHLVESDSYMVGNFIQTIPVDSNEIYYVKIIKNGSTGVHNTNLIWNNPITISAIPNPFNSSVRIALLSAETIYESSTQIAIYDLAGNVVASIDANAHLSSLSKETDPSESNGQRVIIWTPDKSLPSGIYLIRANFSNGQTATKKALYLR